MCRARNRIATLKRVPPSRTDDGRNLVNVDKLPRGVGRPFVLAERIFGDKNYFPTEYSTRCVNVFNRERCGPKFPFAEFGANAGLPEGAADFNWRPNSFVPSRLLQCRSQPKRHFAHLNRGDYDYQ